jgi:hypothetical protein
MLGLQLGYVGVRVKVRYSKQSSNHIPVLNATPDLNSNPNPNPNQTYPKLSPSYCFG